VGYGSGLFWQMFLVKGRKQDNMSFCNWKQKQQETSQVQHRQGLNLVPYNRKWKVMRLCLLGLSWPGKKFISKNFLSGTSILPSSG